MRFLLQASQRAGHFREGLLGSSFPETQHVATARQLDEWMLRLSYRLRMQM